MRAQIIKPIPPLFNEVGEIVDLVYVGRTPHDSQLRIASLKRPGRVTVVNQEQYRDHIMLHPGQTPMEKEDAAYRQGFEDGLRCFAWWNNGVQVVGSMNRTLKSAIEGMRNLATYRPPSLRGGQKP